MKKLYLAPHKNIVMKIIHTSDWHLGHLLYKNERNDEFEYALQQLVKITALHQPDAMVVSGDIFDTPTPSATAQQIFTKALLQIHQSNTKMPIVIIAGNHDGKMFIDANKELWKLANVFVVGLLERKMTNSEAVGTNIEILANKFNVDAQIIEIQNVGIIVAVPHIYDAGYPYLGNESADAKNRRKDYYHTLLDYVENHNKNHLPVVLMAHLAIAHCDTQGHDFDMIGGLETSEMDEFGDFYDYLALGHIHKSQVFEYKKHIASYCGSLIPLSFSEEYPHGVQLVQVHHVMTTADIVPIEIKPLRKMLTLPSQPAAFKDALKELDHIDDNEECYIRLNVLATDDFPSDAIAQVLTKLQSKKARFCEFKLNNTDTIQTEIEKTMLEPSQLSQLSAIEVANYYQKLKNNQELSEEHKAMFAEVLSRMNQNASIEK